MAVVYITSQGGVLYKEGKTLVVKNRDGGTHTIFPFQVEQIYIIGNINITTPALKFILINNIDTVFLSFNGEFLGRLEGKLSKNIYLRQKQFKKLENSDFILKTAKMIAKGKIYNQIMVLKRILKKRKEKTLKNLIKAMEEIYQKIENVQTLNSLRGHEGKAGALYFNGYKYGFNSSKIYFAKRVKRPPTDPVNAILSLLYTFLMNRVFGAVSASGLDPYLGTLHSVDYGRPSLVLDLMEEFRPIIADTLTLALFNLKIIDTDDFIIKTEIDDTDIEIIDEDENLDTIPEVASRVVYLKEKSLKVVISQFEKKLDTEFYYEPLKKRISYKRAILEQAKNFALYIREERLEYKPVLMQ